MFWLLLKMCSVLSFLVPFFPSYPSTALPTPNKKGKIREEKEARDTQLICYCLYRHSEINMTRPGTHRGTFLGDGIALQLGPLKNLYAVTTDHHRICYSVLCTALWRALSPNRALLAFSSLTGRSCLYLGTFSHFQLKHNYYWEFLSISAYARLTFLLFSCLSHHVYLLIILIYTIYFTDTFFIGMLHL